MKLHSSSCPISASSSYSPVALMGSSSQSPRDIDPVRVMYLHVASSTSSARTGVSAGASPTQRLAKVAQLIAAP
eukprot:2630254-Prymnesium_polylepis.3